jgi:hypothetical protein
MKLRALLAPLAIVLGLACTTPAFADLEDRLFDFTDKFYIKNGVDPAKIGGRRQADGIRAVADKAMFSYQRDVRSLVTFGGWSDGGKDVYFTVHGGFSGHGFTKDSAGKQAMEIADWSPEYIFPRRGTDPFGLGAIRQPFMLDLRKGYFSKNPLGLWIHVWVNFTDRAFNTAAGQKALSDLARRNGIAIDGTPIIRTASEIDNLFSKGYVTKSVLPFDHPLRYGICPVVKDPTDSGIAMDQFLLTASNTDGTPLIPSIFENFESLRRTGRWAN